MAWSTSASRSVSANSRAKAARRSSLVRAAGTGASFSSNRGRAGSGRGPRMTRKVTASMAARIARMTAVSARALLSETSASAGAVTRSETALLRAPPMPDHSA